MQSGHRRVDFSQSTAGVLPASLRATLADLWRDRTLSEHRSVSIFATYTLDLLAAGAPAEVLSLACRASLDEVRHAELFAQLTRCYSGVEETPPPGVAPMPEDPGRSVFELAVLEALHLSIGAESYSAAMLHAMLQSAKDPVVRDVVAIVLSDEIHHARMGWAYVSSLLKGPRAQEVKQLLQAQLYPTLRALAHGLLGDPRPAAEQESIESRESLSGEQLTVAREHGYLTVAEQRGLFAETMTSIWIPALSAMGFVTAPLQQISADYATDVSE